MSGALMPKSLSGYFVHTKQIEDGKNIENNTKYKVNVYKLSICKKFRVEELKLMFYHLGVDNFYKKCRKGEYKMGLLKKIASIKDDFAESIEDRKNIKELESKGIIITDFRICNSSRDNAYVSGHISSDNQKIIFCSQKAIEIGSILVDKFLNLYQIKSSALAKNQLLSNETITTVCDYEPYVPNNPARNVIKQNASIMQGFTENSFSNIGTLVLNVQQKATIEQSLTISQMAETVENESKYRYDPVKNASSFMNLINEILKGVKTVNELESKIVQNVLKETSSFLRDMIEMLIKNIKNKCDSNGHYKE